MAKWTCDLSDLTIQRTVGPRAFTAGKAYAGGGHVRQLTVEPAGGLLFAEVQGTRRDPYSVVVTAAARGTAWSGHCTCPVGFDCKHVAAVLLATRRRHGGGEPAVVHSAWEAPIAALVQARGRAAQPSGAPLALQVEVEDRATPYPQYGGGGGRAGRPQGQRIRIRPVTLGRSGNWVKTGVSWRDFETDLRWSAHDRSQQDVMRAIVTTYRANGGHYSAYVGYGYRQDAVYLDELGPALWQLLDQVRRAGVELLLGNASGQAVTVAEPFRVALDLRRSGGSSATLRPVATTGGQTLDAASVTLVGAPAHGLFVTDPAAIELIAESTAYDGDPRPRLVLAPLDPRPDDEVADLIRAGQTLEIPEDELPRFLASYYPALRQAVTVMSGDGSVTLPEVLPPELALTVTFGPDHQVGLDWAFAYRGEDGVGHVPLTGRATPEAWTVDPRTGDPAASELSAQVGSAPDRSAQDPSGPGVCRDRAAEQGLLDRLDQATRRLLVPDLRLTGMDSVSFTRDLLPVLDQAAGVDLTVVGDQPDFRPAELAPVIRLSATDAADDPDWFDLGVTVSVDGEQIPFDQLFVALADNQSHLVLDSGLYFSLDRPELEQLRRLIDEARDLQDRVSDRLRLSVYQTGLWGELLELGVVETQSARWAGAVQGLLDLHELAAPPDPVGFDAQLRPYQRDGFQWLAFLWQHRLGGILADDMGLGKTIQALALVCHAREAAELPGPFLVVAPTSVVANWAHEARRFAPGLKVRTVTETTHRRETPLDEDVAGADLVITSYALFRLDFAAYLHLEWAGLILDEAQFVKNHQAKSYQCARRLPAPFKLAVTGTPMENNLMELWSLLSIVAPGLYPSPQRFSEHYRRPIERGEDPGLLATLRRRVRPLMLRRTKDQVVSELPPKQEQVLDVVLNPKHQKVYQTHLQRERQKVLGLLHDLDKNRFAIFRSLTLLRQLSLAPQLVDPAYAHVSSSKADAFLEKLREVVDEGHRALVFSQFTGFLKIVRDRLDAEKIEYGYLDGRTRNRAARIQQFKTGDAPVFLISLKAGGVGLNLTEADYCFILDPWWNPAVEAQAVDRTHRIGQDKTVMVYRLVAAGTIEEKVMELKARKQALFARVMDDDALLSAPLSVADIQGLFG